jgi:hypothetical protein
MTEGFIPPHGGYQRLLSYRKAEIVFDATVYFCDRFIDPRSRTHDQMAQAARSGKQNIIEGSMASGTSKEMEVKLTNVARASLEELLADYRDFLRIRGLVEWAGDHPYRRRKLRHLSQGDRARRPGGLRQRDHWPGPGDEFSSGSSTEELESAFLKEGGLRERMTRARLAARSRGTR